MFELMRFYLWGRGWRARLARNRAAGSIYTCWRMAAILLLGAVLGVVLDADAAACVLLALGGILAFAFSFAFLRDAKRVHALRQW